VVDNESQTAVNVGGLSLAGATIDLSSPSSKYLLSLESKESRITMRCHLNKVASICGQGDKHQLADWRVKNEDLLVLIRNTLVDDSLAPTTINTLLCTVRKLANFYF
jgi:hypothetical protein